MKNTLSDRLLDFGAQVVSFSSQVNKSVAGRHIGLQLLRSATSAGANYEEACGVESKADFIHKMQLVLKELREALYWLRLIEKAELVPRENVVALLSETSELAKIFGQSVVTAKRK